MPQTIEVVSPSVRRASLRCCQAWWERRRGPRWPATTETGSAGLRHRVLQCCAGFVASRRACFQIISSREPQLFHNQVPRSARSSYQLMQLSRSLAQAAFKDPNQKLARGVKHSRPFFNVWAPTYERQSFQRRTATPPPHHRQQQRRLYSNMASATTFYDFKPLDSKSANRVKLTLPRGISSAGWKSIRRVKLHLSFM